MWKAFQSNLSDLASNVDFDYTRRSLQSLGQQVREKTTSGADVTELPQEYLDLEHRVDALKDAYTRILAVSRVFENSAYDYPTNLNESLHQISGSVAHSISSWAASATRGTQYATQATNKPEEAHRTLPHALSRATATSAESLPEGKLAAVLRTVAVVENTVGEARVVQDNTIDKNFLQPMLLTLNSSIAAATKARANVKNARLYLDATRATLKSATGGPKQEQARLEVESAEEKLISETENAISLMRTVLDNPEPVRNLNELVKAQYAFYSTAAEALSGVQVALDEAVIDAVEDYRRRIS